MSKHKDLFLSGLIDWFFRRRTPAAMLLKCGVALLIVTLGGFAVALQVPTPLGSISFTLDTGAGTPSIVFSLAVGIAVLLVVTGLIFTCLEYKRDQKKKIIAVELRGLRDVKGSPMKESIPAKFLGRRDQLLIDARQGSDGKVLSPEVAVKLIEALPATLQQMEDGLDRSDISVFAGGLAPVPYSFLMGVLLDDESKVELMDWDRDRNAWRPLDETDDGERFVVTGCESLTDQDEVVLAVSVSYPVDLTAIQSTFLLMPVLKMTLRTMSFDVHWSGEKQAAIAAQFIDLVRSLLATRVRKVHLVLAAPNSMVIRFGRSYDKRNLPSLIVYQYERTDTPGYPWGVMMPVTGNESARIVRTNIAALST